MMKKKFFGLMLLLTLFVGGCQSVNSFGKPDAITYFERQQELVEELDVNNVSDVFYYKDFTDEEIEYYFNFDVTDFRSWVESNPYNLSTNDFEDYMEWFEEREPNDLAQNSVYYDFERFSLEEISDEVKAELYGTNFGDDTLSKRLLGNKSDSYYEDWVERQKNRLSEHFLDFLTSSEKSYYEQHIVEENLPGTDDNISEGFDIEPIVYNTDGDYVAVFSRAFKISDGVGGFVVIVRKNADGFQALKTFYGEIYID